jgi:hypothetical protein
MMAFATKWPPAANMAMLAMTVAMDDRLERRSFIRHAGVELRRK